jgi:hypothetical protein
MTARDRHQANKVDCRSRVEGESVIIRFDLGGLVGTHCDQPSTLERDALAKAQKRTARRVVGQSGLASRGGLQL